MARQIFKAHINRNTVTCIFITFIHLNLQSSKISKNICLFKSLHFCSEDSWSMRNSHSSLFSSMETSYFRLPLLSAGVRQRRREETYILLLWIALWKAAPFTFFSTGADIDFPHINFYSSCSRPSNLLQRFWHKTLHLDRILSVFWSGRIIYF